MTNQTLEDQVIAIGAKLDTLIAAQTSSGSAAILAAITALQNTANSILAQDLPTPSALAPVVTAISPNTGPAAGGTVVTVTGSNFTGATGVLAGLVAQTNLVVASDTSLTFTTTAQPAGAVDVQVVDAAGTSVANPSDLFTFV